jgi:multiple sugar transport system permease protein
VAAIERGIRRLTGGEGETMATTTTTTPPTAPVLKPSLLPDQQASRPSLWKRFWRSDWYWHLFMILALLITFIPIIWMVSTSLKDRLGFAEDPAGLIPRNPTLINYRYMLTAVENVPIYMRNSFTLAIGTALLQVFVASLAGYAFARMLFRG